MALFVMFLENVLFGWLPAGLWIPVCAVIGVVLLIVAVKILTVIFDFLFKFIDLFI